MVVDLKQNKVVSRLCSIFNFQGGTLVLTGERGSGKSQLVEKLEREGHNRGMEVLFVPKKAQTHRGAESANLIRALKDMRSNLKSNESYDATEDELPLFTNWQPIFSQLLHKVVNVRFRFV